ncbi:MAG: hypothetical protein LCH73_02825 [Proteobacteria bacterium]|nr:hypothetical protein [Pseudomonadota bacterium]
MILVENAQQVISAAIHKLLEDTHCIDAYDAIFVSRMLLEAASIEMAKALWARDEGEAAWNTAHVRGRVLIEWPSQGGGGVRKDIVRLYITSEREWFWDITTPVGCHPSKSAPQAPTP